MTMTRSPDHHYDQTRARAPGARTRDRRETHTVSTTDPHPPAARQPLVPSIEDIVGDSAPLRSADDLAQAGLVDDGGAEEFIADLYAMRRSDVA
ncbi:hypothetical protein [Pseudonocardia abyssalis]|uniref:Uncharacterized protein n=1 Tax=Pseudonocardia abyssalis TaxID=2792008 RepID=A0ABS6UTQ2_9PSEU|nr:hypothetical protein [Pseudonocardia abyssalis]MBW0119443.1 hypothetical protein [Pseudonocardia abyssalis]MBW0135637.1 hypothetical protein [Pseudonocardia abyssalis]